MVERFWEVDAMRGFALGLMLVFNWSFALRFLDIVDLVSRENWVYWWAFPRFIGFLFVFIVGVSLTLSVNRLRHRRQESWRWISLRKYPRRGLWIFALGLGITAVTFLLYPDRYIYFGVLHLIGVSILLSVPFLTRAWESLLAGVAIIVASVWVGTIPVDSRLLGAIGFDAQVPALDYFPLFPWTGVVLLGIWTGHVLFPDGHRRISVPPVDGSRTWAGMAKLMQFLGQRTLILYLGHQPALIFLLLLLGFEVF